jgi:hypothetical protein
MYTTDDPAAMPPMLRSGLLTLIFVAVIVICAAPLSLWLVAPASDTGPATAFPAPVAHGASVSVPGPSTSPTTQSPPSAVSPDAATRPAAPATGCAAALAYLSTHAAPGFQSICPGYAEGAQALTCLGHAPCAPDERMIVIADPCPAAYMNEAHNSWVLLHDSVGVAIPGGNSTIDPYGYCS